MLRRIVLTRRAWLMTAAVVCSTAWAASLPSGMKVFHSPGATGQLVGVYSGEALEGIVSHPGGRFRVHDVDGAGSVSGHVDAYAVAAGAVLKLPQP
jgi:hypothetical protein